MLTVHCKCKLKCQQVNIRNYSDTVQSYVMRALPKLVSWSAFSFPPQKISEYMEGRHCLVLVRRGVE